MPNVRIPRLRSTRALWVSAGVVNIAAPTVAELTPGTGIKDLSADLHKDTDVGMDKSDSVDDMGVNDTAKIKAETFRSYHGNAVFFRRFDSTTFAPATTDCTTLIAEGELGVFVRRDAMPYDTAIAATQKVSCFEFRSTVWMFEQKDGYYTASIELFPTGRYANIATVAA
jgi:hypothetical protein